VDIYFDRVEQDLVVSLYCGLVYLKLELNDVVGVVVLPCFRLCYILVVQRAIGEDPKV